MYPIVALTSFLFLLLLTIPIAMSLGLAAFVPGWMGAPINSSQVVRTIVTAIDSFPLLAVPLFMVAGDIMTQGGLARRLFSFADALLGRLNGGLAISTVVACMLFGAISGSSPATVAAIGAMAIPLLVSNGYDKRFATVLVTTAGTLGVIVPPSIPMIIYGMAANVSVSRLFMAGIGPALTIAFLLCSWAFWYGTKHKDKIKTTAGNIPLMTAMRQSVWALLAPVVVLGGIYSGAFTPTEAAAIAVAYSAVISIFVFREMTFMQLVNTVGRTALTVAPILIIAGTGAALGRVFNLLRVPVMLGDLINSIVSEPIMLLLLINFMLLLIGMFMETLAAIIVLTPIFLPIVLPYGIDPLHFGLILTTNLAIGFVTPPVGANIFIATGLTKLSVVDICKGLPVPLFLLILGLAAITYVPELSLWLPNAFG
ncbi:C4-dicarboxylate transporter, DctM subunit [Cohaesibacter sp. ES.047]|uniref:TRAP transporter large permease n=1 Tax=Cohaesibacter sp. ES.047 TaxID=1798205 RepID=UPI000BB78914|nr:TRAP transporter large permease [Cohaesibacter sp. ES.047]SNY92716.1 C4-dicarboxylate transporter, DctM subunit [Cohaesibacter sp. ES.047]